MVETAVIVSSIDFHRHLYNEDQTIILKVKISNVT